MRIVIVGAGVAGCIVAKRLSALPNTDLVCVERATADAQSTLGTGVAIGPNAIRALLWHDAGLLEDIDGISLEWETWRTSLTDGTVLSHLPLSRVADTTGRRVNWSNLNQTLRRHAGSTVAYGCEITRITPSATDPQKSEIEWTQGEAEHHLGDIDLLIACDGRYSCVRQSISGSPAIRHIGVAHSRVIVPDVSGGLIGDYEQWFNGPNRLLAYRMPSSQIHISATFPIDPTKAIPDDYKNVEILRSRYLPTNGRPSEQAVWLIDALCKEVATSHWSRSQEQDVLYADPVCNVLYLGDAAHAMVPTLAQGATQAIEDGCFAADYLSRAILQSRQSPREWLDEISRARSDRARFVLSFSVDASDTLLEGADPVEGTLAKTKPEFLAKLSRLYRGGPGLAV